MIKNCFVLKCKKNSKKLEHFFVCENEEMSEKWFEGLKSAIDVLNNCVTALGDPKAAFGGKSPRPSAGSGNMFFM